MGFRDTEDCWAFLSSYLWSKGCFLTVAFLMTKRFLKYFILCINVQAPLIWALKYISSLSHTSFLIKLGFQQQTLKDVISHTLDLSGIQLTLFVSAHKVICFGSVVKLLITHWWLSTNVWKPTHYSHESHARGRFSHFRQNWEPLATE